MNILSKNSISQLHIINIINSLETIASGLFGIFVPIYLLLSGFDLRSIFIYLGIHHLLIVPFFILAAKSCNRFGMRKTAFFRFLFLILFFFSLSNLDKWQFLFWLAPVFSSLTASFMYYPQHFIFANHAKEEKMGSAVASLYAWPQIIGIFMPLVSSLIAIIFGFKNLFAVSLFFYFFVFIIYYYSVDEIKISTNLSWEKLKQFFITNKKHLKFLVIENIRGDIQGVIWPIIFFSRYH